MEHRPAEIKDLNRIMEIVADAQSFLRASGVNQWQNGYPTPEAFRKDIYDGACHVFLEDGKVAGVIAVFTNPESCYAGIKEGSWLTKDDNYCVFHRAAVGKDYRGKGIAHKMLSYVENFATENGYNSVRGDTHKDNKAMRGLLEKRGYAHCGTVYLEDEFERDKERVAYEKLLGE